MEKVSRKQYKLCWLNEDEHTFLWPKWYRRSTLVRASSWKSFQKEIPFRWVVKRLVFMTIILGRPEKNNKPRPVHSNLPNGVVLKFSVVGELCVHPVAVGVAPTPKCHVFAIFEKGWWNSYMATLPRRNRWWPAWNFIFCSAAPGETLKSKDEGPPRLSIRLTDHY